MLKDFREYAILKKNWQNDRKKMISVAQFGVHKIDINTTQWYDLQVRVSSKSLRGISMF